MTRNAILLIVGYIGERLFRENMLGNITDTEITLHLKGSWSKTYDLHDYSQVINLSDQIVHLVDKCGYSMTVKPEGLFFE